MAKKSVYFFNIRLRKHSNDRYCNEHILNERMKKIISENSVLMKDSHYPENEYKSLDVTEHDDLMHSFIEVISEKENGIFMRFTRQQPRNNYRGRDYKSYQGNDLLPGNDESINGIEIGTYAYLNYEDEIIEVVSTKSAPNEKLLAKAFRIYDDEYYVELVAIPNEDSVEELYGAERPYIRRLEIGVPRPNVDYLFNMLDWDSERIAEVLDQETLNLSIGLGSIERGGYITEDAEETKDLIDVIRKGSGIYNRAIIYGKKMGAASSLRKFNFFDENFGFYINIKEFKKDSYNTIAYSLNEIILTYYKKMLECYRENEMYFKMFLEERDE